MLEVQQLYDFMHIDTHQCSEACTHAKVPDLKLSDYEAELMLWMAAIWRSKGQTDTILLSDAMIAAYARYLMQGIKEGYSEYMPLVQPATGIGPTGATRAIPGASGTTTGLPTSPRPLPGTGTPRVPTVGIDYSTPHAEALEALTRNTWQFAAAKNHHQLRSLTEALKGPDGRLRSWNEFKTVANEINNQHIQQWLRAEYELAVAGSQMAGKWQTIQAQKSTLPRLRYSTAGDERVRQSHRPLDGIVRPVDDPFWNTNYPPNGWGCRCMVEQVDQSVRITPDEALPATPDMPDMFKVNLGQQGLAFGPKHPYFIDAPVEVREKAAALRKL